MRALTTKAARMRKRWLAVVVVLIGLAPPAVARAAVPTNVTRPRVTGEDGRLFPGSVLTETPGSGREGRRRWRSSG